MTTSQRIGFFFLALALCTVVIIPSTASALTITAGGNMEDRALMADQITTDICASVYICFSPRYISERGKAGLVTPGAFDIQNLQAYYANTAQKTNYAQYTETSVWADSPDSDQTQITSAFTAQSVYSQIADEAYHSPLGMGGDSAPSAAEAMAVESANTVNQMSTTDFYSEAETSDLGNLTAHGRVYIGGALTYANQAVNWNRTDTTTHY
jgi:hypothetical protein